jgi:hypothetical protein
MDRKTDGQTDRRMDRKTDGQADRRMDRKQMVRQTVSQSGKKVSLAFVKVFSQLK